MACQSQLRIHSIRHGKEIGSSVHQADISVQRALDRMDLINGLIRLPGSALQPGCLKPDQAADLPCRPQL